MGPIVARDVREAVGIAERLKGEGRYDWFRGQVRPWSPYSSLLRRQLANPEGWRAGFFPRLARFCEWAKSTPELAGFVDEDPPHALFAIAQHYGVPTHYIDFTTEPRIAGFFATDGPSTPEEGVGCIYCLNSVELHKGWPAHQAALKAVGGDELSDIECLHVSVASLWRRQARWGVFLFSSQNWNDFYPLERIEFPHTKTPFPIPRAEVYPIRKSRLEQLLDEYFDAENSRSALEQLKRHVLIRPENFRSWEAPPGGYQPGYVRGGEIAVLESWRDQSGWHRLPDDDVRDMRTIRVPLPSLLGGDPEATRTAITAGLAKALQEEPEPRRHHVEWIRVRCWAPSRAYSVVACSWRTARYAVGRPRASHR